MTTSNTFKFSMFISLISILSSLFSSTPANAGEAWWDIVTGEVTGGRSANIGQRFVSGPYACGEYVSVNVGGVSYQTAASTAAAAWQAEADKGNYEFFVVRANCDNHQPASGDSDNENYCDNRANRFGDAIIAAGVPEWVVLRGANTIDSTPNTADTHFATAIMVSSDTLMRVGNQALKDEVLKRLMIVMRSEDNSHTWAAAILAMADSLCPGTLVVHETRGWEVIWDNDCPCAEEQAKGLSSDALATAITAWTAGTANRRIAFDVTLTEERNDHKFTEEDFRGRSISEKIIMIWGSKIPDYDHPEFGRLKAMLIRHHVGIHGTFDPLNNPRVDDRMVFEFPGRCESVTRERDDRDEADRLASYGPVNGLFEATALGGAYLQSSNNVYGLLPGGLVGLRVAGGGVFGNHRHALAVSVGVDMMYHPDCYSAASLAPEVSLQYQGGNGGHVSFSGGLRARMLIAPWKGQPGSFQTDVLGTVALRVHPRGAQNGVFVLGVDFGPSFQDVELTTTDVGTTTVTRGVVGGIMGYTVQIGGPKKVK